MTSLRTSTVVRPPHADVHDDVPLSFDSEVRTRRVLVVDDHRVIAQLMAAAVRAQGDLECVGHVQSADAAMRACLATDPDVVLLDIDLPGRDGLSLCAELVARMPDVRVVIVSASTDHATFARVRAAGAHAFVPKDFPLEDVMSAVRSARPGALWTPDGLAAHLDENTEPAPDGAGLTPREREVLAMLGRGRSVQQISRELGLSVHTTRGYVKSILAKLGVSSQLEAVLTATGRGLIPRP